MFVSALKIKDIALGGMKAVKIEEKEIVICNYEGRFFALDNHCSHMHAGLDKGTLEGYILTCPLHFAQFDITTGEVLSGPVPQDLLRENLKESLTDIKTYLTQVAGDSIQVDLSKSKSRIT
jgi:nitrite reductase/ring-hydroxylating ferredoxin subunit